MDRAAFKVLWISTCAATGLAVVIALLSTVGTLPKWSLVCLVLLGALSFSFTAVGLEWVSLHSANGKSIVILCAVWMGMGMFGFFLWPATKTVSANKSLESVDNTGNIRERAVALSQEIMEDLYENGWPQPEGQQLPLRFIVKMPTAQPEIDEWIQRRSIYFHFRFFERVLDLRNDFIQHSLRDPQLEEFFRNEKIKEDINKQLAVTHPDWKPAPTLPQEIQTVAQRLIVLANEVN